MLETPAVTANFPVDRLWYYAAPADRVVLTGEGSSQIFPGAQLRRTALRRGYRRQLHTESAADALNYDLGGADVFVASNSGKTRECVQLIRSLRDLGAAKPARVFGIAGDAEAPVILESDESYLLSCGPEDAVAATKSVVEQALLYDLYFRMHEEQPLPNLPALARRFESVLEAAVPSAMVEGLTRAPMVYFAGRNDGVAAELTLKTNEILRRRADYLPGTYALHGIEEVMDPRDVVIWIEPPETYEEKIREVLVQGVGLSVFAVSSRETSFPTMRIPSAEDVDTASYLHLAAGWNILVEAGIAAGIDMDKPERARKVGNEYSPD
jgi:glucosamine--fructose-6-phosphate aminotransferase (isomerizing)